MTAHIALITGVVDEYELLERFLSSLDEHTHPSTNLTVYVVADVTHAKPLAEHDIWLEVVPCKKQGFGPAFNEGIKAVKAAQVEGAGFTHVVIANADVIVEKGWDLCLLASLDEDPCLTLVHPLVNTPARKEAPIEVLGPLPCFFWMQRIEDVDFFDEVFAISGGSHHEDSDYVLRLLKAGGSAAIITTTSITHTGGGILRRRPGFERKFAINKALLEKIHGPVNGLWWLGILNGEERS